MNWAIRLMNLRLALACCAALLLGASSTASAAPMAIDFSLIPATTMISATGTAVVDSSLLAPNIFTDDLNDLVSVSITFTGLTASPSSTTFTKDDLAFWVFSTEFWERSST